MGTLITPVPLLSETTAVDHDSAHFALALEHFDVLRKQPHAPGYLLFLAPAAVLHQLGAPPLTAVVWTSVGFSMLAVVVVWRLGRALFGPMAGILAAVLLASSPMFWSRGELGLSYTAEAAGQAIVGFALWRALAGSAAVFGGASLALGLSAGIRQDILLFAAPLWECTRCGQRRRGRGCGVAPPGHAAGGRGEQMRPSERPSASAKSQTPRWGSRSLITTFRPIRASQREV